MQFQPGGSAEDRYGFIQRTFQRCHYSGLRRAEKGIALRYLGRMAGYSRKPLTRLVRQYSSEGQLRRRHAPPVAGFVRKFTAQDVALLVETDTLHGTLSGPATKRLMQRALEVFGDTRYDRLASISVAHLYNLRKVSGYATRRQHWTRTRATQVPIGERRPPDSQGRPDFIRIDSVHQGDLDGVKGIYHINAVDGVTQWQLVAPVSGFRRLTSCRCWPSSWRVSPNGSEYINRRVAELLNKLNIEFTKSRPRHSNDNALVETKNGAVVRKQQPGIIFEQLDRTRLQAMGGAQLPVTELTQIADAPQETAVLRQRLSSAPLVTLRPEHGIAS